MPLAPLRLSLALLALIAVPCRAGLLSATSLCWASDGTFPLTFASCSVTYNDPVTGIAEDDITVTTPNPDGGPDQIFVASGWARALPDTFQVAVDLALTDYRRDMFILAEDPESGVLFTEPGAAAGAVSTDEITVTGGVGVYSLTYILDVTGTFSTSDPFLFRPQVCTTIQLPADGTRTDYCIDPDSEVSTFTLSLDDLPFAAPVETTLSIVAVGFVPPIAKADVPDGSTVTGDLSVDFGGTFRLKSLLVTDSEGNPIPGVALKSASGFAYPLDARNTAAVPEPALLAPLGLLALGLLRTAGRRRRAARRSAA